jgi:hypothetical protein
VADHVIMLDNYRALDATQRALQIANEARAAATSQTVDSSAYAMRYLPPAPRRLLLPSLHPGATGGGGGGGGYGGGYVKSKTVSKEKVLHGDEELNLLALEQLVEQGQTRAISELLCLLSHPPAQRRLQTLFPAARAAGGQAAGGVAGCGVWMAQLVGEVAAVLQAGDASPAGAATASPRAMLDVLTEWRGEGWQLGSLSLPRKYELAAAINRLRSAAFNQRQSDKCV